MSVSVSRILPRALGASPVREPLGSWKHGSKPQNHPPGGRRVFAH